VIAKILILILMCCTIGTNTDRQRSCHCVAYKHLPPAWSPPSPPPPQPVGGARGGVAEGVDRGLGGAAAAPGSVPSWLRLREAVGGRNPCRYPGDGGPRSGPAGGTPTWPTMADATPDHLWSHSCWDHR